MEATEKTDNVSETKGKICMFILRDEKVYGTIKEF